MALHLAGDQLLVKQPDCPAAIDRHGVVVK
jgi:hypothetical protein